MSTPHNRAVSIRARLANAPGAPERFICGATGRVRVGNVWRGTSLGGRLPELAGRSVLILARDTLAAALALIEIDGVARRLIVCPPDVQSGHLSEVIAHGGVDAIVSDSDRDELLNVPLWIRSTPPVAPTEDVPATHYETEWVLLTSGTTGAPKLFVHTLATLTAALADGVGTGADCVWGTFYDIRRYGGLQIFFRAVLGRGSLVLAGRDEALADYLVRLAADDVTHVSGTPSHWRRVLMSPQARAISPRYVRLSGEIADQAILNALRAFYPQAQVAHAFASTEAGVGFDVNDGLEGFPASIVAETGDVQITVAGGSLRIRSRANAARQLGAERFTVADDDGFVDTGDIVERRGDRYFFLGRRNGIINVGGLKVYPEEVEAAINRHPAVRMSMVWSKRSPITGSLIAADVVLHRSSESIGANASVRDVEREIVQICHDRLAPHKVPAMIRFVAALELADAGKLARHA